MGRVDQLRMATKVSGLDIDVAHDFASALGLTENKASPALIGTDEWDQLLHASASDVVFMAWQWQTTWWNHFGAQSNYQLHLLIIRGEKGALLGVAPLFISSEPLPPLKEYHQGELRPEGEGPAMRLVRIVGGIEVADYLDILAPADRLPEVWSAIFDYLMQHHAEWDAMDLHSLPEWSPSREIVAQLASEHELDATIIPEDACPVVQLPDNWDTYLMSLRKKDRHELRRKVRKLEGREDVRWYLVPPTDEEAMRTGMTIFLDLHRKSGVDKAHFMNDEMASFFFEMVHSFIDTGWLDLAILEVNKQPAAAYLSLNYGGRIYLYNSGYDPKFGAYSAGIALLAYRIHKAINQGCRYFDFLRGDEPYKYDFGGKNTFVYRVLVRRG